MAKVNSSTSSEGEERYAMIMDEKKRKRMISNRESARRSRLRRQNHIQDLTSQIATFQNTNRGMAEKISSITQQFMAVELENQILTNHREELTTRLESLEILLSYVSGHSREILPQWQIPSQPLPVMASVGMFNFD